MSNNNINLHIERLVLDGVSVDSCQQPMLKATLESELGGLLAQNGIVSGLQSGGSFNELRTDSINVGEKNAPCQIVRQIARAVYKGVNQ